MRLTEFGLLMEKLRKLSARVPASAILGLIILLSMGTLWGAVQPSELTDVFWFLTVGVLLGGMAVFHLKLGTRVGDEGRVVLKRMASESRKLSGTVEREMEGIRAGLKREVRMTQLERDEAKPEIDSRADSELKVQLTNRLDHLTQVIGRSNQARLSTQIELTERMDKLRQAIDGGQHATGALALGERIDRMEETLETERQARLALEARLISLNAQPSERTQDLSGSSPTGS